MANITDGLIYFSLDTDFFSDNKIKILKARFGADGIIIYLYLLCEIYKCGYYIQVNEDFKFVMANELKMTIDKVEQVITFLLSRSLFDNKLFQSDAVLTSTGIQRRYQRAIKERARKRKTPIDASRFWLLEKNETDTFIQVHPDETSSRNIDTFSRNTEDNSEKIALNKSKVNNIYLYMDELGISGELRKALEQFIEMRETKEPLTLESFKLLLIKLDSFTSKENEKIQILNKSTICGYRDIFELTNKTKSNSISTKKNNASKSNKFHNFEQQHNNMSNEELEEIANKSNEKKLKKLQNGELLDGTTRSS